LKETKFLSVRVDNQCDLPRLAEEMPMNEQVVCREKDAEIRMRVVPAEDYFVRELFIDVAS
jgi:hypothetical protein